MKKLFHFIIMITIFMVTPSAAMEAEQHSTLLTCIKSPRQAYYVHHNRVIVNGLQGCHIINPSTDKIISKIHKDYSANLAIHPNKTKFALAQKEAITIYTYDYKSDKVEQLWTLKEHPENPIYSSIFSPTDDTIITRRAKFTGFMHHNYNANKTLFWNNDEINIISPLVAFNPIKAEICLAHNNGDITVYTADMIDLLLNFKIDELHRFCEYSPDGSIIICGGKKTIFTLYPDKKEKCSIPAEKGNNFDAIALHPNGSVLAILSSPENIIRYWDICGRKRIHKHSVTLPDKNRNTALSFSPDGMELLVTYSEGCMLTTMNRKLFYYLFQKGCMATAMHKKLFYYLFLFRNLKSDTIPELPDDIIKTFIAALLKVYYY